MSEKEELLEYFKGVLIRIENDPSFVEPVSNKTLIPIAYYKQMHMLLVLYRTEVENEYCAHSSNIDVEDWPNSINPPKFGFAICSSYDNALEWLVDRYIQIRTGKSYDKIRDA